MPVIMAQRPMPHLHVVTDTIAAMKSAPRKGLRIRAVAQMLILRGCWWKKYMSLIHISPPPAAEAAKNPFRILAAMYELKD